jgi:hypothetical protein
VCKAWYLLGSILIGASILAASGATSSPQEIPFDRHDLSGVWWVDDPGPQKLFDRAKNGDAGKCETCHISEHTAPEPPLTQWAHENLMIELKMTDELSDKCEPVGLPAQFWFTQLYPFEFVVTPGRVFQFFEKQNEWRTIWLNRGHPKDLFPTHMGDSVGKWEGNVLVIDTVGLTQNVIEPVGVKHRMSPVFHLVERWERVSANELDLDATYYDEMAWGSEPWGGLKKKFILQAKTELHQGTCSPEENKKFDDRFLNPAVPAH